MSIAPITAAQAGEYLGGIRAIKILVDSEAPSGALGTLCRKLTYLAERVALDLAEVIAERDALIAKVGRS